MIIQKKVNIRTLTNEKKIEDKPIKEINTIKNECNLGLFIMYLSILLFGLDSSVAKLKVNPRNIKNPLKSFTNAK